MREEKEGVGNEEQEEWIHADRSVDCHHRHRRSRSHYFLSSEEERRHGDGRRGHGTGDRR